MDAVAAAEFVVPAEGWATQGMRPDLTGRRIGEVVIEGREGSDHLGVFWRCRCDCGQVFFRRTVQLFKAARDGVTVACRECTKELLRGRSVQRHDRQKDYLRLLWAEKKTLWHGESLRRLTEKTLGDLVDALGPIAQRLYPGDDRSSWELVDRAPKIPVNRQQAAYLYPINDESGDREWRCVECGAFASRVFGCIRCVEAVCVGCVAAEKHVICSDASTVMNRLAVKRDECEYFIDNDPENNPVPMIRTPVNDVGATLRRIGSHIECSVERVRQIEHKAIGKLRQHAWWFEHEYQPAPQSEWIGDPGPPAPWAWCRDHGWIRPIRILGYEVRCCERGPGLPDPRSRPDPVGAARAVAAACGRRGGPAPWWWCLTCGWTRAVKTIELGEGRCLCGSPAVVHPKDSTISSSPPR